MYYMVEICKGIIEERRSRFIVNIWAKPGCKLVYTIDDEVFLAKHCPAL